MAQQGKEKHCSQMGRAGGKAEIKIKGEARA